MQKIVLFSLGVLYVFLGVWCAVAPTATANALGYELDAMGKVEYIVVYGGLEWGLGLAMIFGAVNSTLRSGVFFMTIVFSTILPVTRCGLLVSQQAYNKTVLGMLTVETVIVLMLLIAFFVDQKSGLTKR